MQEHKTVAALIKPSNSALAIPARGSNSVEILSTNEVPGLKLEMLCFLWLTKKFSALEPADKVQWLKDLAHVIPDNLLARLFGEYILNRSEMYDSYDFGPFCIRWAEYFANKCIEAEAIPKELQGPLDVVDPGKASSIDSEDAELEKLPTKERKVLDISAGGPFACIVDILIKRLMSNTRYTDNSYLQPLAIACILNASLIVELMVRDYCNIQSIVRALEQLICLDDERPACLLLDILLAANFGTLLVYWQEESLHYHAELFNHTSIVERVLLLARQTSYDGPPYRVLIPEVYSKPYRSLIQTVPASCVLLIPQAERLALKGSIEIIDSLVKALDKNRKKLRDILVRDYEDTQRSLSLLQLAARKNFGEFVELLLIREQWPEYCIEEAFLEAVKRGHVEIVKIFFDRIPDLSNLSYLKQINKEGGGELTHSLVSDDQLLRLFAKKFLGDPNVNWEYAEELMEMGASNGISNAVKFLLPLITIISDRELRLDILSNCLNSACEYGNQEEAKYLIAAGAPINKRKRVHRTQRGDEVLHPFYSAVNSENFMGEEKILFIEYLLNKGAELIEEDVIANLRNEKIDMDDLFIPLFIQRVPGLANKIMNSSAINAERRLKLLVMLFSKYKEQLGSLISEIADIDEILALAQDEFEEYEGKQGLVAFLTNLKTS